MKNRVVCLNCIDGRTQLPVLEWIKTNHGVEHVDMVTEPGVDGVIANQSEATSALYAKVRLSIEANQSAQIFMVGHSDCKGNPKSDDDHKVDIQAAVVELKKEFPETPIIGVWVNEDWKVEEV